MRIDKNEVLEFRISEPYMTIGELHKAIADLATGRVEDNNLAKDLSINCRLMQLETLASLTEALKKSYEALQKEKIMEDTA